MPVDDAGLFDETLIREKLLPNPETYVGMHIFKSNEPILELLGSSLLKVSKFRHPYPFCWRTHKPVIYRATNQWFITMDEKVEGKTLREVATTQMEGVSFYPPTSKNRLGSMIANRPDWCVSRQRDWGVPIAFFRDKTTGEVISDEEVHNFLADIFEKEGTDVWFSKEINELLNPSSGYNAQNLEKVTDILDVWFDSGSTWQAVLKSDEYDAGNYPANLYLEGSDQHRGWFQTSLLVSCAVNGKSPYKNLITHGFTNDANGKKMSKSKGNVVAPNDVSKKFGVEILRLWVGMVDYMGDQKISDDILKQMAEQYRKTRNTIRFLLANVADLETIMPIDELGKIDKWIVHKAKSVFDQVEAYFKIYEFSKALSLLNHFITAELSGIHMDISKDRLYCNAENDQIRRSAQSAMAIVTKGMLTLLAPVLTYTIDEVLEYAPKVIKDDAEDVFDLLFAPIEDVEVDFDEEYMTEAREKFFEAVDVLKKDKKIKATLELAISTNSQTITKLDAVDREDWFTISKVVSQNMDNELASFEVNGDKFKILLADESKCPRCWKLRAKDEETLCERCNQVLN
jgi:isoleucyl-tRNA synthetase